MEGISGWRRRPVLLLIFLAVASILPSSHGDALAASRAYVANGTANSVSVFDVSTQALVATVPVTGRPVAIASTPGAPYVYTANEFGNSVSVIDTATNSVVTTIAIGNSPEGIAANSAGTRVYATNFADDTVAVIDGSSFAVVATIPVNDRPAGIAVHPDNSRVYVACQQGTTPTGTVQVINAATNTVAATITGLGAFPTYIAIAPDGLRAYVTNFDGTVSVIDTVTNTVTATIPVVSGGPVLLRGVDVNPASTRAYVVNAKNTTLDVIDTSTNTVAASVAVGSSPQHVRITPDGLQAWVANLTSNSVSVIDTATNTVSATLATGAGPFAVAFATSGGPPTIAGVSPQSILEYETRDITITGTGFQPGATADFGEGTSVHSVSFVSPTQLVATVFAVPNSLESPSVTNPVTVQNRDGQSFTTSPIFLVTRDRDGDGIADADDNCPNDFNPNRDATACATLQTVAVTANISTETPGAGQPNFAEYCVTFPGNQAPYFFAPPDDRTVQINATVGGQSLDRRVPESVLMVIPDGLQFQPGPSDIVRCYITDISQQVAVQSGTTVTLEAKYHNTAQPIGVQLFAPGTTTVVPLFVAEVDFPEKTLTVGNQVQIVGGTLAVSPTTFNLRFETNPTTQQAVFTLSALGNGAPVTQIDQSSLLFEGTLPPAGVTISGNTLQITVNQTALLRALRKRVTQGFTAGQVERVLLTGRLNDGTFFSVGVDIVFTDPVGGDAAGLIDQLIADIQSSTIDSGLKNSLIAKLQDAKDGVLRNQKNRACGKMSDFINQVNAQRGKPGGIPAALADDWLRQANAIRGVLQC